MAFGSKEYNQVFDDYRKGQKWLNSVEVEIVGGEADIPPLTLLRIYDDKATVDNELALASGFCLNKAVRFYKDKTIVHEFVYNGGDLSEHFMGKPYLLDVLLKMSYGLMLKKLTPPSEGSESEGRE